MNRREFLHRTTLVTGAALIGVRPGSVAAEPPPETTRLRLIKTFGICFAPEFVAEDLLRGEGFTELEYLERPGAHAAFKALASGDGHFMFAAAPSFVSRVDAGDASVVLAGIHVGCYELFGNDRVQAVRDLKGKSVAVTDPGSARHLLVIAMSAFVGLDPQKDVRFVTEPAPEAIRLFTDRKIDAFMGFPPEPQELRAKKIGHVVIDTGADRPWSQYFCCMVAGNREFVRTHPVATKRALRAFLKATDICAVEPERAARLLVDRAYTSNHAYALQTLKEISYSRWREFDATDTLRFYALRLREAGMIRSSPQQILAQGTDWRFLNQLKRELKG